MGPMVREWVSLRTLEVCQRFPAVFSTSGQMDELASYGSESERLFVEKATKAAAVLRRAGKGT